MHRKSMQAQDKRSCPGVEAKQDADGKGYHDAKGAGHEHDHPSGYLLRLDIQDHQSGHRGQFAILHMARVVASQYRDAHTQAGQYGQMPLPVCLLEFEKLFEYAHGGSVRPDIPHKGKAGKATIEGRRHPCNRFIAAQLALAWVLAKGEDLVPIPGTKRRKYLEENVKAADIALQPEEVAEIDAVFPPDITAGERY